MEPAPNAPPAAKTNPYLFALSGEAPGAPGLIATRCLACGAHTLGRVRVCAACLSRDVEPTIAGQSAEIVEFSIARHSAGGFEAPYAIGLVRTSEGITLFAPLDADVATLAPGLKLTFTVAPRNAGAIGFAYAPAPAGGEA